MTTKKSASIYDPQSLIDAGEGDLRKIGKVSREALLAAFDFTQLDIGLATCVVAFSGAFAAGQLKALDDLLEDALTDTIKVSDIEQRRAELQKGLETIQALIAQAEATTAPKAP